MPKGMLATLAVIGVVATVGCGGSDSPTTATKTAPSAPPDRVVTVPVTGFPQDVTSGFGKVWTVGHRNGVVYAIDPRTARVAKKIIIGGTYYVGLGAGEGAVWVYRDDKQQLIKIDPDAGRVTATKHVGQALTALTPYNGSLWAISNGRHVVRIDPATMEVKARIRLPRAVGEADAPALVKHVGWLWAPFEGGVAAIDPDSDRVAKVARIDGPVRSLALTENRIYYVFPNESDLLRIDQGGSQVRRVGRDIAAQPALLESVAGRLLLTDDAKTSITAFDYGTDERGPTVVLRRGLAKGAGAAESIGLSGMTVAGGAVWLSDWAANAVYRVPLSKLEP